MDKLIRRIDLRKGSEESAELFRREWLVTNGLGGYASGTISGSVTWRYHGLLIAALPEPFGRTVMLNHLAEAVQLADGRLVEVPIRPSDGARFLRGLSRPPPITPKCSSFSRLSKTSIKFSLFRADALTCATHS